MEFKKTEEVKNSPAFRFCELCLEPNPEVDDGYTTCCNERVAGKGEALEWAKNSDIEKILTKYNCGEFVSSHGSLPKRTFELKDREVVLNVDDSVESLKWQLEDIMKRKNKCR